MSGQELRVSHPGGPRRNQRRGSSRPRLLVAGPATIPTTLSCPPGEAPCWSWSPQAEAGGTALPPSGVPAGARWMWRPSIRGRPVVRPSPHPPRRGQSGVIAAAPGVMDVRPPLSESVFMGHPNSRSSPGDHHSPGLPGGPDRRPGGFRAARGAVACRAPGSCPAASV